MHKISTFIILCFTAFTANSEPVSGRIVGITDGDTVQLMTSTRELLKIRLSGIDAPEKSQPFGEKSKQALSSCCFNKDAVVESYKEDRYGRVVGKVLIDGADCNLIQIELGMAWHYKKYENEQELQDRSKYSHAEYLAKKGRTGLWVEANPTEPWDWRKLQRNK